MRIIAGQAKGRRLRSARGLPIRPTSDLVRGAIFSMLESIGPDWSRVLDLYAGTGALGIEALSRGAGWADFVEHNPRLCAIIRENLECTGLANKAIVYCISARKAISLLKEKYGIILLDPPYSDPSTLTILEELARSSLSGEESTIVVEHPHHLATEAAYGDFRLIRNLRHGDTSVSAYQFVRG